VALAGGVLGVSSGARAAATAAGPCGLGAVRGRGPARARRLAAALHRFGSAARSSGARSKLYTRLEHPLIGVLLA
jgi:hypothetical protein